MAHLADIQSILKGNKKVLGAILTAKVMSTNQAFSAADGKRIKVDNGEFSVIADRSGYCLLRCLSGEKKAFVKTGEVIVIEKFVMQDQIVVVNRQSKVAKGGKNCEVVDNIPPLEELLSFVAETTKGEKSLPYDGPVGTISDALKVRSHTEGITIEAWVVDVSMKPIDVWARKPSKPEKWLQTISVEDSSGKAALSIWKYDLS